MSVEPFIYLLLFSFFALITFIVRWLRGELEKIALSRSESNAPGLRQEIPTRLAPTAKKNQPREGKSHSFSSLETAFPRKKRRKVTKHPRSLREMQHGIVLMTILGPCRALEQPNEPTHF